MWRFRWLTDRPPTVCGTCGGDRKLNPSSATGESRLASLFRAQGTRYAWRFSTTPICRLAPQRIEMTLPSRTLVALERGV
ncbi:hypothetical protein EJ04DRAFT_517494 [Polyplosphaeria fusca]|uniref:Uncharacterized protein n=1 Tax=Polyplosphaeria fusca TaxID=682080 RepID=A0A9P4QJW6_9PLEO|nr:hypothetical protein EJ04DRAFT_517494 [Polyplosphaeria fusca]